MNHMKPGKTLCADSQENRERGFFFVSAIVALYSRWETQGKSQPTACRNYLFWCFKLVDHQQAQFRVYAETALKGL